MANQKPTETAAAPTATDSTPANTTYTLHYRRQHPGGGPLGRCSYGVPGVHGIVVFDMGLFADGNPPATITVSVPLATPKPSAKVAAVTSAVVAAANTAATVAAAAPAIATPAQVANVAQAAGSAVVAAASKGTSGAAVAAGKAAAAAVLAGHKAKVS